AEIFACGGTIDKYIGDAILAVFGLPTSGPEDAAHALCCAGRMLQALDRLNAQRSARGESAWAIGIGINYVPAVLGGGGSDQGLSFTVIGDTVNTAHRLQILTRTLQTPLVVADALIAKLDGRRTEELDRLVGLLRDQGEQALRGRSMPVRIWTKSEGVTIANTSLMLSSLCAVLWCLHPAQGGFAASTVGSVVALI